MHQLEDASDIITLDVLRIIENSKTGKVSGPDKIDVQILKLVNEKNYVDKTIQ